MQRFTHLFFGPFSRPELKDKSLDQAIEHLEERGWEIIQVFTPKLTKTNTVSDIPHVFDWRILAKLPAR